MRKKLTILLAVAMTALLAATAAFAAVTFDPDTGTGFVGKGDVQQAFGWNNTQLQQNASGVTFSHVTSEERVRTCQTPGRPDLRLTEVVTRTTAINSQVAYETRNNKKGAITGFNLTGFGASSEETTFTDDEGNVITVGSNGCPEGYNPSGAPETSSSEELIATFNGTSVPLNWPPAPAPEPVV